MGIGVRTAPYSAVVHLHCQGLSTKDEERENLMEMGMLRKAYFSARWSNICIWVEDENEQERGISYGEKASREFHQAAQTSVNSSQISRLIREAFCCWAPCEELPSIRSCANGVSFPEIVHDPGGAVGEGSRENGDECKWRKGHNTYQRTRSISLNNS
ncbi:hypothetical protein B0H17DRAFT_1130678 [Mycena rosella]|uniref:Uncharacterized protein n=1 Tax=Mycena rosella TaxID=1033263 RepID=A0AAD7DQL7_MYCRO|nr:hypothetical protein B0H17DRAFT_1130678 [Mycena rosella]